MFRKKLVVRALLVAFTGIPIGLSLPEVAFAQSNATGTIFGQVESGAGTTVQIENIDTGVKRSITPDSAGRFQFTALPTGKYRVILSRENAPVETREPVEVLIGQGSEVSFGKSLATVRVAGTRQTIDVSNSGATSVFTAEQLSKLPVQANVGAIIQLAPGTTRGDSRYGGGNSPSFGGSGASENAYYINGFPVTNQLLQVGAAQLPFNSIAQAQVLTGGYSAEFGRSTGGVTNIITKSGTNEWLAGIGAYFEPDSFRAKSKSSLYPNVGQSTDGQYYFYNGADERERYAMNGYLSGPIIKDKLFVYLAGEFTRTNSATTRQAADNPAAINTGWEERSLKVPRYLGKIDWNITDNHHLEYTRISDKYRDHRDYYGFDYQTLQRGDIKTGGADYLNWGPTPAAAQQGSDINIVKYTGYITDDLTVTALYGKSKSPHEFDPFNYNPSLYQISAASNTRVPGLTYISPQTTTGNILTQGAHDDQKGYRLDVEYKLNSQHTLRAGVDDITIKSKAGSSRAGGGRWVFQRSANPNDPIDGGAGGVANDGSVNGSQGFYVKKENIATISTPKVEQSAQYIEDKYQVTDRILLSLGLRNEQFSNYNGDGQVYVEQRHQLAPRLGATWDVRGDSSLKISANAGRYHLQLPTNVAVRGAGSSLFTFENFTYTGIDPVTGAPTGLQAISPVYSNNNEFGQSKDPRTVAGQNLKANYQDEIALGFEQALLPTLNIGAKVTYRKLRSTIDDFCDPRPFLKWAERNGVDTTNYPGFNCALFNPGESNTFNQDINGDGTLEKVVLSKEDLGFPKVKRTYAALDLFAEYPFDGKFYGKVLYTLSRSSGNTEGQLLSDIGQADVATTQSFDFPEISENSNGLLPNDRKHQIKAYGYYQFTSEWGFGANFLYASGRPKNCIGNYPDLNNDAAGYGSAFFYCDGQPSPRGSRGRLPKDIRLDLNVTYTPEFAKGLTLKVDGFNIVNRQSIQNIDELYNDGSDVSSTYGRVISYTEPRFFRFSVNYDYKF